ncbi:MAG: cell division protein SepF [Acidimicrobiales bacterium]
MAGMLRKGMSWLGLGPDDEYDDYDDYDDEPVVDLTGSHAAVNASPVVRAVPGSGRPSATSTRVEPVTDWDEPAESASVRVLPSASGASRPRGPVSPPEPVRPRGVVRPVPASASAARPHVVTPKTFNDAQEVGDWFRKRQPVIVNLQDLDRDLARRLLDFSSGVAYGLGGTVERVASHVYLLSPIDVEISPDDRRRLRERGLVED